MLPRTRHQPSKYITCLNTLTISKHRIIHLNTLPTLKHWVGIDSDRMTMLTFCTYQRKSGMSTFAYLGFYAQNLPISAMYFTCKFFLCRRAEPSSFQKKRAKILRTLETRFSGVDLCAHWNDRLDCMADLRPIKGLSKAYLGVVGYHPVLPIPTVCL